MRLGVDGLIAASSDMAKGEMEGRDLQIVLHPLIGSDNEIVPGWLQWFVTKDVQLFRLFVPLSRRASASTILLDNAGRMRGTAPAIFDSADDEDRLALVSRALSTAINAFATHGSRVVTLLNISVRNSARSHASHISIW
jgi:hypothetical protein